MLLFLVQGCTKTKVNLVLQKGNEFNITNIKNVCKVKLNFLYIKKKKIAYQKNRKKREKH